MTVLTRSVMAWLLVLTVSAPGTVAADTPPADKDKKTGGKPVAETEATTESEAGSEGDAPEVTVAQTDDDDMSLDRAETDFTVIHAADQPAHAETQVRLQARPSILPTAR